MKGNRAYGCHKSMDFLISVLPAQKISGRLAYNLLSLLKDDGLKAMQVT